MKEFEEWWHNHRGGALENFELDKNNNSLTWRAALDWVLSRVEFANSDGSIIQDIKDELNGVE